MSLSALRHFILPPVIASAAVFSLMSSPLAVLGDKPVNIRFEEEPIFDGRLRDIAPPYVGLVTLLSFGAGITAAAVLGWQNSARRSAKLTDHISQLEGNLSEKDALLRELKLSESRIQISGLTGFLDEEVPFDRTIAHQNITQPVSQPVVAQTPTVIQPKTVSTNLPAHHPTTGNGRIAQSVASASAAFAPAQTLMRHVPSQMQVSSKAIANQTITTTSVTSEEFEELQQQMRMMMEKMQQMQNHLQVATPATATSPAPASKRFQVYYESPSHEEFRYM